MILYRKMMHVLIRLFSKVVQFSSISVIELVLLYLLQVYLAALAGIVVSVAGVPSCSGLDHLKLMYLRFCMWVPDAAAVF